MTVSGNPLSTGPLWQQTARRIEQLIRSRDLCPGDRLPTESVLAADFGVNRHTVRRALKHLEAQGRLEARQGRGRFVRLPAIPYQLGARPRFSSTLEAQSVTPSTKLLDIGVEIAPEVVADALSLRNGSKVIHIERIGFADEAPVSISSHWLPLGRFPSFITCYERRQSITAALRDCGLDDYVRRSTRVTSRLPTSRERELLGLPRHVPLIVTRSKNVDGRGWPIEYGEARMASDRVELEVVAGSG